MAFISGGKRPNLGGEWGTGELRTYVGTKNIRKHVHFILGYMGISGEMGNTNCEYFHWTDSRSDYKEHT